MARIATIIISYLWILPYWWLVKIRKFKDHSKYSLDEGYKFINTVAIKLVKRSRVDLTYTGINNIPKEGGYLVTPNHQGLFDPLVLFATHQKPIKAILKKELTERLILKDIIEMLDLKPIDRKNVRETAKVIKEVSNEVANGQPYFVFPEGTRSKKGNKLLEFKGGTYKIALKAKVPIVPVALIDSFKPFDSKSLKRLAVKCFYLKPIPYEEYKDLKTNEIAKLVQTRIEECIAANT